MKFTRWNKAQKAERGFWSWLNTSFAESTFIADTSDYFAEILALTGIQFHDTDRYLDLGCGPTPVFLALKKGFRVASDPLMEYYLKTFEYLRELTGVHCDTRRAEEFESPERFNTVFMLNCLNHCENLKAITARLSSLVAPAGHLVLTQHCHTQKCTQQFFSKTSSCIDTCHPHHFQKEDVIALLEDGFDPVREICIDDLDVQRVRRTNPSVRKKTLLRRIGNLFSQPDRVARYIYRLVAFYYRKELAGRPAISNYLFVFRRREIGV